MLLRAVQRTHDLHNQIQEIDKILKVGRHRLMPDHEDFEKSEAQKLLVAQFLQKGTTLKAVRLLQMHDPEDSVWRVPNRPLNQTG
jgi:hypothetical protein